MQSTFPLCVAINAEMESKMGKRSRFEANWAVRNASICPLPYKPDSCKENTSGHLIMQIPKVGLYSLRGMLPLITRLYTERTCSIKNTHTEGTIPKIYY